MTTKELARKVIRAEPLFILDVRNAKDFVDWKVEGKNINYLNVPYFELLEGVDKLVHDLPKEGEILVVCAKEGSSKMVAEMLAEAGVDSAYLRGGMKAWSEHLEPLKVGDLPDGGELFQFVRYGKGCLSYMVISKGEAAIIDPTRMTGVFLDFAKEKGAIIKHVFDTHLHADHISGGRKLAEVTGATYYLPPNDADEVQYDFTSVEDGMQIIVGNSKINTIYSPGHTIGSTTFIIDDIFLMTGDILFIDSIGRPDLAGLAEDWVSDLRETLYDRYKELVGNLVVLPAHFMIMDEVNEDGTIARKLGELYNENHGLNIDNEQEFRKLVTEHLPPQPNAYKDIRKINMGKISPDEEMQREMEIGPNRCAVR